MTKIYYDSSKLSSGEKLRIKKILRFREITLDDIYFIVKKFFSAMAVSEMDLKEIHKNYTEEEVVEYLNEAKSFFLQVLQFEAWNSITELKHKDGRPKKQLKNNMLVYDEEYYPAIYKDGEVYRLKYIYKYWNDFMIIGEPYV